jgi:hypothetical protein
MENEDIIKLAIKLTEENNSIYKSAARNQAFMIKADDGSGIADTFITVKGPQTADDWKNQFTTAGFGNVVVSPFRSGGNLNFTDVDSAFLAEISKRAKWRVQNSPTGYDTPFTDYNPYAGKNLDFDSTDTRVGTSYSIEATNKYQEYIDKTLLEQKPKNRVFAGWYDGPLINWITKLIPLDADIEDILKKQYAHLYGNAPLQKYILDKDIDPKSFSPTKFQINSLGIQMFTLFDILSGTNVELDDVPEDLILPQLKIIVDKAKEHKYHKQYDQEAMNQFQTDEMQAKSEKDTRTWNLMKNIMRGISR